MTRSKLARHALVVGAGLAITTGCTEDPMRPSAAAPAVATAPVRAVVDATGMDLGTLGGSASSAQSINDSGYVAGWSYTVGWGGLRAVRWSPDGTALDLGLGDDSQAMRINRKGQIVGYRFAPSAQGFVWDPASGAQMVGSLGGTHSYAMSINDAGVVAGYGMTPAGQFHSFTWTAADGVRDIGTVGGAHSYAQDINNRGEVVGYGPNAAGSTRGFFWSPETGMVEIPTLGGSEGLAFGINDAGQVTGYAARSDGAYHAFLWSRDGGIQDLGALGVGSYGQDVNEKGEVVGYGFVPGNWSYHAILWSADSGMRVLDGPAGGTTVANGINAASHVVGFAQSSDGAYHAHRWGLQALNRAPTASAGGPYAASEGTPIAFLGEATDPDGDVLTLGWSFGDAATASGASASHAYADDGSFTATFTATDPSGLSATATAAVVVQNVAPSVQLGGSAALVSGDSLHVAAPFTDPGALDAPWSSTIVWGDGQLATATTSDLALPVTGAHRYLKAGSYTVRVEVTDKDGGQGAGTLALTVSRLPVTIDVEPKDATNTLSLKKGGQTVTVALLSTAAYDARGVDVTSVLLTSGSGTGTRPRLKKQVLDYDYADVNRDGRMDLVLTFDRDDLAAHGDLTLATTQLVLLADDADGRQLRGANAVVVRP